MALPFQRMFRMLSKAVHEHEYEHVNVYVERSPRLFKANAYGV